MKFSKSKYLLFISLTILFLLQNSFCFARELEVPGIPGITEASKLPEYLKAIFDYVMGFAGILALLFLIIGAVSYLTSAGNPEKMKNAVDRIKGAIFGLILLLSSVLLINTINPELKKIEIETIPVPGLDLLCEGKYSSAPLLVSDTTKIKDCSIEWKGACETDAADNPIANATYVLYAYSKAGFKDIEDTPIRIKCGGNASVPGGSYVIVKESPGVYFYQKSGCRVSDDNIIPSNFGPSSIDNWQQGNHKSVRLVNGDDKNKGPFYGVIVFQDENQTGDDWDHIRACGNFACSSQPRWNGCYDFNDEEISNNGSVTVYQWVGYDDSGKIASAGNGVGLYTRPNWTGGRYLIPNSAIGSMLQIEPKNYPPGNKPPDYSGSGVPDDEQKLCKNFGYQAPWLSSNYHCLNSIQIFGNYLLVLSDNKKGGCGAGCGDSQRFPISTNLLGQIQGKYTDYQTQSGPIDLSLDWYYNDGNNENWLTIIPLANKLP